MFGLGMIGSAISNALSRLDFKLLADIPFDWANDLQMAEAYNAIESACVRFAPNPEQMSFVWSAGKSGFYSTESDTNHEFLVFQELVKFASKSRKKIALEKFQFHCVSSAGGLFEGQRVIRKTSSPTPIRPYGNLKKRQEDFLLDYLTRGTLLRG